MAYIQFRSGFEITSDSAVDKRILLTKAEMLTAEENYNLPAKYFAICLDDGEIYLYDVDNEIDTETGKFRLSLLFVRQQVEQAIVDIQSINEKLENDVVTKENLPTELPDALKQAIEEKPEIVKEAVSEVLPGALAQALESQALKDTGLQVDEDGNISVALNEQHLQVIDNKIDVAFDVIQAIDGNI